VKRKAGPRRLSIPPQINMREVEYNQPIQYQQSSAHY
jgi:hypothetical protein